MKRFNIVVARDDGGVEVHPMKEWLRRNPSQLPAGVGQSANTSHQLRGILKRLGWAVEELETEVRLIAPGSGPVSAVEPVLGESQDGDGEAGLAFGLEAQLRDFIAHNLKNIPVGGRTLRLYSDAAGRSGIEYPTHVGPIDILTQDDTGRFVVFELKLDRGPDRALGQLARYMGWVRAYLAKFAEVKGIIVARTIDDRLRYAVSVMTGVTQLEYEINFRVRESLPLGV